MHADPAIFRVLNEIGIIAQLASRLFEGVMPDDMTLAQFTILNHFTRVGGDKSPAALASAFQVTRATMTSTLQKLAGKGLVLIEPDPADGRGKRVSLTAAGRRMRDQCVASLAPEIARLAERIDGDTLSAIEPQLMVLRRLLDADRDRTAKEPA